MKLSYLLSSVFFTSACAAGTLSRSYFGIFCAIFSTARVRPAFVLPPAAPHVFSFLSFSVVRSYLASLASSLQRAPFRLALIGALGLPAASLAFPPAPYYTLFGLVRDQVGATLQAEGAELVLLRNGVELGRAPVLSQPRGDYNYTLRIHVDQNIAYTRSYSEKAVPAKGLFSVVVEMNGEKFYPINVNGNLQAEANGERVRLDLNLGVDSDRDGLPDAWEEWQMFQAGIRPGANGWDLSLITRDGDFDGDGVSNYDEYIAGTFAGDPSERFELRIVNKTPTGVKFEFFTITGKIYGIEESPDLRTWSPLDFSVAGATAAVQLFQARSVDIVTAEVTAPAAASRFYRLSVR